MLKLSCEYFLVDIQNIVPEEGGLSNGSDVFVIGSPNLDYLVNFPVIGILVASYLPAGKILLGSVIQILDGDNTIFLVNFLGLGITQSFNLVSVEFIPFLLRVR